ncbi:MAG: RagB/SusD family nutrient uptake outer membrane protein, partial [Bacteroidales bacterium]|nr:RagB/SusD family nutrient uptake outer membrane protein [Bacteroidales bacterium]
MYIPYIDETTDVKLVTNDVDVRPMIIADLTAGTSLPINMGQIGRFNQTVCQVFLAKAQMQMYEDYSAADALLGQVISSGKQPAGGDIGLMANYGDVFDASMRNDIESVYTVQYSVNDNSGAWNAGRGEVLNFPYKSGSSPGGCCGFFNPTQEFVNSFNTVGGLPMIDIANQTYSYNPVMVTNDQGVGPMKLWQDDGEYSVDDVVSVPDPADPYRAQRHYISLADNNEGNDPITSPAQWSLDLTYVEFDGQLDPRVDWSAGRRGVPYWDWGVHTGQDWIRDQTYSGPYSPKKQVYKLSQEGTLTEVGNWTSGYTSNGYRMIRYADVLLLKAECEAMSSTGDLGFALVNQIRARAANQAGWVEEIDVDGNPIAGVYAANYVISEYPTPFANQAEAMHAIMFERKLELGQEGHR